METGPGKTMEDSDAGGRCDLHTHTAASDGSDSPEDLVGKAADAGLRAIAVTDHDTVDGLEEAVGAGRRTGVEVIPGVELSVLVEHGNMHLLGYFIDPGEPEFLQVLKRVQRARADRNPRILEKLAGLGIIISMDELEDMARGGQIGRPHIARALVAKGAVKDVSGAFAKYLKKGARAYVPKSILRPEEAISAVHGAGGVAVLAHPVSLDYGTPARLERMVLEWVDQGLDGIECYYSEHDSHVTGTCLSMCSRLGLVATGGSDYHGKAKPHIALGKGRGGLSVPYACVEALKKRWVQVRGAGK